MTHETSRSRRGLSATGLSFALITVALLTGSAAARAETEAPTDAWRQTVYLYGMGALIEGDAHFGNFLQVPVDVDMGDFFESLKFGAMAAYRVENDDWSFTGDMTYMNLGQGRSTPQSRASIRMDTDQLTAMATVGRHVAPHLEAIVSLAYFDVSADLRVRVLQQSVTASREADWVDGLVGLAYETPLQRKWRFTLRGEVGGGGSDLTWHALTKITHQNSDRFGWYVGYRAISYDYEDGQGRNYQRYDLTQHGPGAGIAFSF